VIADSGWRIGLPRAFSTPVDSRSKIADRYQGIPSGLALVTAAVVSVPGPMGGIFGGVAGIHDERVAMLSANGPSAG